MEAATRTVTVEEVVDVVVTTLGIEDRVASLDASSPLFGIEVDDEDFTGDVFETMGTLTDFVARRFQMTSYGDSAQWSGSCP